MAYFSCRTASTAAALIATIGKPARLVGDGQRAIEGLGSLGDARPRMLCWIRSDDKDPAARLSSHEGMTVVMAEPPEGIDELSRRHTLVIVPDPRRYYIRAFQALVGKGRQIEPGIAPSAVVHPSARIASSAVVGPGAFIDRNAEIGDNSVIMGGVQVYEGTRIGRGVFVQAHCVLGSVGQSYEREDDGEFILMPHLAAVTLGDGVRIGTATTIVRGTLQDTAIGEMTIIGNHVVIGHNVTVGRNCHVGAGVILCGSSRIDDECWISPGALIKSVPVARGAMVGAGAIVTKPVAAGKFVTGFPAREAIKSNDYNQREGR